MRKLIVATAVCVCVLYLSSCGGNDTSPPPAPVSYTFTDADYGSTQTIAVGDLAVFALPANPSTGYGWHRSWTPKASLKLTKSYYTPDQPQLDGSGGTQYYVFKALQTGTVVVTVQYGRWGTGSNEPAQKITLKIVSHRVALEGLTGSLNLKVGETLALSLPENGSTGFSWKHSWTPESLLELVDDYYVPDATSGTGGGGTRYFVFKTLAVGQVVLTAQYGQWWAGGATQDPRSMTLNVAP